MYTISSTELLFFPSFVGNTTISTVKSYEKSSCGNASAVINITQCEVLHWEPNTSAFAYQKAFSHYAVDSRNTYVRRSELNT